MFKFVMPKFIFKIEKWKWNDEFRVYVSNMGHYMDEHKKLIPIKISEKGYVAVPTNYGLVFGHRLVMKTWCPTANMESLTVDHLDHNKRNNAVENLEWVTRTENLRRAEEDFIPCIIKKKQGKACRKSVNKNLKRYNRSDFTLDDLEFIVNDHVCGSVEEAYAYAVNFVNHCGKKQYQNCVNTLSVENFTVRYTEMLNCCNNSHNKDYIDGKVKKKYFGILTIGIKVKKQEDEE